MYRKQVVLVIPFNGYNSVEYTVSKNLIEQAGFTVVTASNATGIARTYDKESGQSMTAVVDIRLNEINLEDFAGIFFIGGPGALEYLDNQISYDVIRRARERKMLLGAICVSSRILARAGVLKDTRATGWDGDGQLGSIFKEHQVLYQQKDVVVDGRIITAVGPSCAREFGENIITLLQEQAPQD